MSLPPVYWLLLLLTHFKPVFFPQVQGSGCPKQPEDAACLGGWVVLLSACLSFIVSSSSRIPVCLLLLVPLGGAEIRLEAERACFTSLWQSGQECPWVPCPHGVPTSNLSLPQPAPFAATCWANRHGDHPCSGGAGSLSFLWEKPYLAGEMLLRPLFSWPGSGHR